jgi:transposase
MNEREYRCRSCWHTGSITTGTWLERSKIPLRLWYELVWCFAVTHAAHKAGKLLGVSPKTCWLVYQTIRKALVSSSLRDHHQLSGTLEVDESFYGGLFKNLRKNIRFKLRKEGLAKRGRGAVYRKQPVFGIYKRNGTVYLDLVAECSKKELETIIKKKIEINSEVFSDTFKSYNGLVGLGYVHSTVDHGMEIYVDGRVHVNGMEGFWGLSKTNMHTYKGIRKANWIYYLKEMEFRYNNRQMNFDKLVLKIIGILMSHREESFVPY